MNTINLERRLQPDAIQMEAEYFVARLRLYGIDFQDGPKIKIRTITAIKPRPGI